MKCRLRVFGTDVTVLRPIVISVLKDVGEFLGAGQTENIYYYYDENGNIKRRKKHAGASFNATMQNFKEVLKITDMKEEVTEGFNNSLTMMFPDEKPFFLDKDVDLKATLIKQNTTVRMSIDYIVQDRTLMESCLNLLKTNAVYSSGVTGHNLEYVISVPKFLRNLLISIYGKKKSLDTMPKIEDYLDSISDSRLTFLLPHDGDINGSTISIREKLFSLEGRFEGDLEDLTMQEHEDGGYYISLEYTFDYPKIVAINVDYPLYVYNQRVEDVFFNVFKYEEQIQHKSHYGAMNKFYDMYGKYPRSFSNGVIEGSLTLPPHDKRLNNDYPTFYSRLLTQLIRLDPNDKSDLINIKQLTGIKLKPSIERLIMGSEREYVGKFRKSLFWIALYENDKLLQNDTIDLDQDGNMRINKELDMRNTYRIAIFIMLNIKFLQEPDRKRVIDNLNKDHLYNREINSKRKEMANTQVSLVNPKGDTMINPYTITNDYLSNLDILAKIHGLTDEQKKAIANNALTPTEAFFNLTSGKLERPCLDRYTQLMSIYYCLDVK